MDAARLLWIVLFSSIGLGLFLYGKKQWKVVPLTCGLALMIYPYFVSGKLPLIAAGAALTAIPYFIRY
ncbi:MAG: hypothetical protein WBO00_09910 [Steroidobacteraceae bacterium]